MWSLRIVWSFRIVCGNANYEIYWWISCFSAIVWRNRMLIIKVPLQIYTTYWLFYGKLNELLLFVVCPCDFKINKQQQTTTMIVHPFTLGFPLCCCQLNSLLYLAGDLKTPVSCRWQMRFGTMSLKEVIFGYLLF